MKFVRLSRYRLTATAVAVLILLFLFTVATLARLLVVSVNKEQSIRENLFERDLKGLANLFDKDTGYVLERNLPQFLASQRAVAPLELPRAYYVATPAMAPHVLSVRPPINCGLMLVPVSTTDDGAGDYPDRLCAYVTADRDADQYLYFTMTFMDTALVPLRGATIDPGASAVRVSLTHGAVRSTWWLLLQSPGEAADIKDLQLVRLAAFRERADGTTVRDERLEGWAYIDRPAHGVQTITIDARLDDPSSVVQWRELRFDIARRYVQKERVDPAWLRFKGEGTTVWSLPALLAGFFDAHAQVAVWRQPDSGAAQALNIAAPPGSEGRSIAGDRVQLIGGDLVIYRNEPVHHQQVIPGTSLEVDLIDPGTVVQRGVWQTAALLSLVLLGFLALALFVFNRVLRPILTLSLKSRELTPTALHSTAELPYGGRNDEIGALSRAFNNLLKEMRERAEEARRKQIEEMRNRELNLKTIGHEIRSPLQALLGLHAAGDPSRHYIDRMVRAVKYLFSDTGPQASFDSIPLALEHLDVASFLAQLAANAATAGIADVQYEGPTAGVICFVDPNALEDAVSHVLANANRHRRAGTPIRIAVSAVPAEVCIEIANKGANIPEEIMGQIFDLYVSHAEAREESNQGLGLFVTRNYIARMSGTISVLNRTDGVSFVIRLPVSRL